MGDKSRCGILKTLQQIWKDAQLVHHLIEKTVAIINACHDHALYKPFGGSRRQELPYLSDIMQVIVDCLTSLVNLFCRQTTSQGESRDEYAVYFRR